jgi:hypothetical protein
VKMGIKVKIRGDEEKEEGEEAKEKVYKKNQ